MSEKFFEEKMFNKESQYAKYINEVEEVFIKMKEKPLFKMASVDYIFRFLWLRTSHDAVCIKAVKKDDDLKSHLTIVNTNNNFDIISFLNTRESILEKNTFNEIKEQLENFSFWDNKSDGVISSDDASIWLFEINEGGQYHFNIMWSPEDSNIKNFGKKMLDLVHYKYSEDEFY